MGQCIDVGTMRIREVSPSPVCLGVLPTKLFREGPTMDETTNDSRARGIALAALFVAQIAAKAQGDDKARMIADILEGVYIKGDPGGTNEEAKAEMRLHIESTIQTLRSER